MFICFFSVSSIQSTYLKVFKLNIFFFPLLSVCFRLLFRYCYMIRILCTFGLANIEKIFPFIFILLLSKVTKPRVFSFSIVFSYFNCWRDENVIGNSHMYVMWSCMGGECLDDGGNTRSSLPPFPIVEQINYYYNYHHSKIHDIIVVAGCGR